MTGGRCGCLFFLGLWTSPLFRKFCLIRDLNAVSFAVSLSSLFLKMVVVVLLLLSSSADV